METISEYQTSDVTEQMKIHNEHTASISERYITRNVGKLYIYAEEREGLPR
jgi:hypothetical protein